MLSWRKVFLAVLTLLALASGVPAASDWQIVKIGGREYLTVDNIAKFYGLPTGIAPVEKRIRIDNGTNSLEFQLDSREVMINGVRSWLCFPVTEKDGKYLVSRVDLAKTLEPQLRPQMIPNLGQFKTVVLDPGHGGHDKGATSGYGCEKDFALDVARDIKPLLEAKGIKVKMTRNSDIFVPLELRARIANAAKDSIFVSIHFNADRRESGGPGVRNFLTYTARRAVHRGRRARATVYEHGGRQPGRRPKPRALDVRSSFGRRAFLRVRPRDQTRPLRGSAPDENPRGPGRGRISDRARREPSDRAE